jgi:hypothetical protein
MLGLNPVLEDEVAPDKENMSGIDHNLVSQDLISEATSHVTTSFENNIAGFADTRNHSPEAVECSSSHSETVFKTTPMRSSLFVSAHTLPHSLFMRDSSQISETVGR